MRKVGNTLRSFLCMAVGMCFSLFIKAQSFELPTEFKNARIIGLGEQWHGSSEFIHMRCELLNHSYDSGHKSVFILENSFNALAMVYLRKDPADIIVQRSLQQFWNHPEMTDLIQHVRDTNECRLYGCDPLEDCRFVETSAFMIERGWFPNNIEELKLLDVILDRHIAPNAESERLSIAARDSAFEAIEQLRKGLSTTSEDESSWAQQMLQNRQWLVEFLHRPYDKSIVTFRDSIMFENVKFILNRRDPESRVFLWAANLHIDNEVGGKSMFLGEYMSRVFGEEYRPILCRHQMWHRGEKVFWNDDRYSFRRSKSHIVMTTTRKRPLHYHSLCKD
jgi:erythromycin esterase